MMCKGKMLVGVMLATAFTGACGVKNLESKVSDVSEDEDEHEDEEEFGLSIQGGKINYAPDANGNTIPDFSYVGYKEGLEPIPDVAVAATVLPGDGDDAARIQAALDQVSALPLTNGFRGAVLLKKGEYQVAGNLRIKASGVVLRGEGSGANDTIIRATGNKTQKNVVEVSGTGEAIRVPGTEVSLTEKYVPFGHRSFQVSSTEPFKVGDKVILKWKTTDKFISAIGMDKISGGEKWNPFSIDYERTIKAICGNTIVVDAPLVQAIDQNLTSASLYKYTFDGRISNVGVENIRFVSNYKEGQVNSDEDHAESAIFIDKAEHGWVRNVQAFHFIYSAAWVYKDAKNFTVSRSKFLDPVSLIDGSRRYSFKIEGALNLYESNEAENGRHDFVTGGRVAGPNVFLRSRATKTHNDSGPHLRWATGTLYDNIVAGELNVQDRGDSGKSGHGWTGAQHVFWNSRAGSMICENPPTAQNFSFGFVGDRKSGNFGNGRKSCNWQSQGKPMAVDSLYEYQLAERKRVGEAAYTCAAAEAEITARSAPAGAQGIKNDNKKNLPASSAITQSTSAKSKDKDKNKDKGKKKAKGKDKGKDKNKEKGKAKAKDKGKDSKKK